jgi:hypothetical protein
MSDRLYRHDHSDSDIFMPGSLWKSSIRTLGDYIGYLRQVNEQSDKSYIASKSDQPKQSSEPTACFNCNCATKCSCNASNEQSGDKSSVESNDGFADNLQYTNNNASTSPDKAKVRGYPCVVVGADCESRDEAESKPVPFSEH